MIDEHTGEVALIPAEEPEENYLPAGDEGVAQFVNSQRLPVHMMHLPRGETTEQSLLSMKMYSDYVESPCVSLKGLAGEVITVIGAIIYEQGPYTAYSTGKRVPGYYEVRLKLDKTETKKLIIDDEVKVVERHVIAKCSGTKVAELIVGLIDQLGWYDWDGALQFEVALDERHGAIYLRMI